MPPGLCLPYSNPSTVVSRAILPWPTEHVLHLLLAHVVAIDVRLPSFRVDVKTDFHITILLHRRRIRIVWREGKRKLVDQLRVNWNSVLAWLREVLAWSKPVEAER